MLPSRSLGPLVAPAPATRSIGKRSILAGANKAPVYGSVIDYVVTGDLVTRRSLNLE